MYSVKVSILTSEPLHHIFCTGFPGPPNEMDGVGACMVIPRLMYIYWVEDWADIDNSPINIPSSCCSLRLHLTTSNWPLFTPHLLTFEDTASQRG